MSFSTIDPILREWSRANRIPLYTEYRGAPVRSFDVVIPTGERRQIWVEKNGDLTVIVWDYGKRRKKFDATLSNLYRQLDAALHQAKAWK